MNAGRIIRISHHAAPSEVEGGFFIHAITICRLTAAEKYLGRLSPAICRSPSAQITVNELSPLMLAGARSLGN